MTPIKGSTGLSWIPCVAVEDVEHDGSALQTRETLHGSDFLCLCCDLGRVSIPDISLRDKNWNVPDDNLKDKNWKVPDASLRDGICRYWIGCSLCNHAYN